MFLGSLSLEIELVISLKFMANKALNFAKNPTFFGVT